MRRQTLGVLPAHPARRPAPGVHLGAHGCHTGNTKATTTPQQFGFRVGRPGPGALPASEGQVRRPAPRASSPASTSGVHTVSAAAPSPRSGHYANKAVSTHARTQEGPGRTASVTAGTGSLGRAPEAHSTIRKASGTQAKVAGHTEDQEGKEQSAGADAKVTQTSESLIRAVKRPLFKMPQQAA